MYRDKKIIKTILQFYGSEGEKKTAAQSFIINLKKEVFYFHCKLLIDAGFAVLDQDEHMISGEYKIKHLTWAGYELIDSYSTNS